MVKFKLLTKFIEKLNEKPFKYIPLTGFITSFIGDVICQFIKVRKQISNMNLNKENEYLKKYSFKRSLIQGFGTVLTSPLNIIQNVIIIPYLFPNKSKYRVIKSVIYTSVIIVPSQQYLLFNYFSLMHFGYIDSKYVKSKHKDAYLAFLTYILPLVAFSFYYLTPVTRMLFAQVFSIIWSSYISYISNELETAINYM